MKTLHRRPGLGTSLYARGRHLMLASVALAVISCGSTVHLTKHRKAVRTFEEARELGAEEHAPYEYYSAKVRIAEAKHQAAHAEYQTAAKLSDEATTFSEEAIQKSKTRRRGAQASIPNNSDASAKEEPTTASSAPKGADQ